MNLFGISFILNFFKLSYGSTYELTLATLIAKTYLRKVLQYFKPITRPHMFHMTEIGRT